MSDSNAEQIALELDTITSSEEEITNRLDVKFTADTVASLVSSNKKLPKVYATEHSRQMFKKLIRSIFSQPN